MSVWLIVGACILVAVLAFIAGVLCGSVGMFWLITAGFRKAMGEAAQRPSADAPETETQIDAHGIPFTYTQAWMDMRGNRRAH